MNYQLVSKTLGIMLLLLASAMGGCLALGYALPPGSGHSAATALNGWEISMAITGTCGGLLRFAGRKALASHMLRKDALGIVGIGWLVSSTFASFPYLFCEPRLTFAQALFESVSGLTTTGASVFSDLAPLPETILLWRSLTQWLGGMGILAMFVLVSSSLGAGGKSLFRNESSMHSYEVLGSSIKRSARSLWLLYIILTLICIVGLRLLGMTIFQAVNHAMATVSTGGFGTENASIDEFNAAIKLWITFFMLACGVSFPLYLSLYQKRCWSALRSHEEALAYLSIVIVASLGLTIGRGAVGNFTESWIAESIDTLFNVASIITSTGFVVGDYDAWPALAKGVILSLMIIGGCAGSTAGGLKVSRILLLFKILRDEIHRAYRPNLVATLRMNGRTVSAGSRGQLLAVLASAAIAAAIGSYLLIAMEPHKSALGCVTAVVSALSNSGPAFADFGPTLGFSGLSAPGMILLSLLMILGRLEYIALLVLLSRPLWKRF